MSGICKVQRLESYEENEIFLSKQLFFLHFYFLIWLISSHFHDNFFFHFTFYAFYNVFFIFLSCFVFGMCCVSWTNQRYNTSHNISSSFFKNNSFFQFSLCFILDEILEGIDRSAGAWRVNNVPACENTKSYKRLQHKINVSKRKASRTSPSFPPLKTIAISVVTPN